MMGHAGLTIEEVETAQQEFKKYDADSNGVIDKEELGKLVVVHSRDLLIEMKRRPILFCSLSPLSS